MTSERPYKDPLTPEERREFEESLVYFCDRQLDFLGDVRGLNVLYAGGSSLLWIEGLSQRIGGRGSLVVLDVDGEALEETGGRLGEADLVAPVSLVRGDVFSPPFEGRKFDLVYSAGLFHELNVAEKTASEALKALAEVVHHGGRVATTDFVNSVPAAQIEDEALHGILANELDGRRLYGIGSPERLIRLHEFALENVTAHLLKPHPIKHLDKVILAEKEPERLPTLPPEARNNWRERRAALLKHISRGGYTRPATLYLEGRPRSG